MQIDGDVNEPARAMPNFPIQLESSTNILFRFRFHSTAPTLLMNKLHGSSFAVG
jgi:hypothetical protein